MQSHKALMRMVATALFAAMILLLTALIKIPVPLIAPTGAYIHPGDSLIYTCAWFLGGPLAAAAAGIGSFFADMMVGAVQYMFPTLIIKAIMGIVSAILFRALPDKWWGYIVAMIPSALVMIIGYGAYEWVAFGKGVAIGALFYNVAQGVGGILIALPLIASLRKIDALKPFRDDMKG